MTKLIGISGSLRRGSFNTALLRATAEFVPGGVELAVATIHGIALYDADVESAEPGRSQGRFGGRPRIWRTSRSRKRLGRG
jgi:NAD(P)H-dependent FMN reductase